MWHALHCCDSAGARFLSLAFLQTATAGSCVADWDGDPTQPIGQASFGSDIAVIQAHSGNVIPSFGGYTADTTDTEIADSCTSAPAIAAVYESLITTYHPTGLTSSGLAVLQNAVADGLDPAPVALQPRLRAVQRRGPRSAVGM